MQRSVINRKFVPKMLVRNLNDVIVSWKHLCKGNTKEESESRYKMQICDEFKQWRTIYWGKRTDFKIDGLAPCTCYNLRIQLKLEGDWIYFKIATEDEGTYSLVLHMSRAVKLGKMPVIRKIAHNKPHLLETENKENKTPLIQAIDAGDTQVLQLLITLGANVNTPLFYNKRTPLMVAISTGKLQMASILVDKGADVTATDVNGLNVLHYAVDSGLLENVKFALNLNLDVNCMDNKKWTPLLRAAILNVSEEIVNLLLESGADVTTKDVNGFNYEKHKYIASLYPLTLTKKPIPA